MTTFRDDPLRPVRVSVCRAGWEGRGRGRCVSILVIVSRAACSLIALTRTKFSLNSISYIRAKLSQLQRYRTSDRAGGGGESFTATAMTSPIRLQRQLRAFCARVREQSGGGFRSYGSP